MTDSSLPAMAPFAIFEALEVAVLVIDTSGHIVCANRAFRDSALELGGAQALAESEPGRSQDSLFDRLAACVVNPDHARAAWVRAASESETCVSMVELRNGRHIRQTVKRLMLPDGPVLLGEFVDLELQAKVMENSNSEYRKIFDEGPVGITVVDIEDLSYVRVNPRMAEIVGYSITQLLSLRFTDITHPEDRDIDADLAGELFTGELPYYQIDKRFIHADGHVVWGRLTATLIRDAYGRPLYGLGLIEDISANKQAEQGRQRLEAQLRQSQKLEAIGTLASGVAHEINNPIQGVLSYAELIAMDPEASEELRDYSQEIITECAHMSSIVRNLLGFSRREPTAHSPIELADVVSGALMLIRAVLRHDQIALELAFPPELPPVHGSAQQLRQVVLNLVTNARDSLNERYAGADPNKIIELRAAAPEAEPWVLLSVRDRGLGMSPALIERVFDPFFTTKNSERGTGLGLSVTRNIVADHGGTISVESVEGEGTTFHVRLPRD